MGQLTTHNSQLTAILILGHGSPVAEANETLIKVAEAVRVKGGYEIVQPAFLQFARPDFAEAVDILVKQGVQRIIVHPYFLYMGAHVRKDLPLQVKAVKGRYPDLEIILAPHLGYHAKLIEVAMERIEEVRRWEVGGRKWEGKKDFSTSHIPHPTSQSLNQHPIEAESFRIIGEYLDESRFSPLELSVIKRVIHATGDFEYADLIKFGNNPIEAGLKAILRGADIITDVRMVEVGINRGRLNRFGGKVRCFISDDDIVLQAKDDTITRTAFAIRKAFEFGVRSSEFGVKKNPTSPIVAVGNAPTALRELIKMVKVGQAAPALIIGVPVGFVDAEESKGELTKLDVPYICIKGKKGGSTVAVAIVNAMLMMAEEKAVHRDRLPCP